MPFPQPERALGFFWTYRHLYPERRNVRRDIAGQYQNGVQSRSQKGGVAIQEDPEGRRDDFVDRYFRRPQPDQVVAIIKARDPARIMTAIGQGDKWHGEMKQRWVDQYNFEVNDPDWGRMFVRLCPYFPSKRRAKGLVEKLPHSRRYRLLPHGYQICLVYLKLFEKIYAPLTAGILKPVMGDRCVGAAKLSQLDQLYTAVVAALDNLVTAVGLKAA